MNEQCLKLKQNITFAVKDGARLPRIGGDFYLDHTDPHIRGEYLLVSVKSMINSREVFATRKDKEKIANQT